VRKCMADLTTVRLWRLRGLEQCSRAYVLATAFGRCISTCLQLVLGVGDTALVHCQKLSLSNTGERGHKHTRGNQPVHISKLYEQ
jgi:hypothetical protein